MSNNNQSSKSVAGIIAAALVGGGLVVGGMAMAGVFEEKPGVEFENGGIDINLPDDINIGKKNK